MSTLPLLPLGPRLLLLPHTPERRSRGGIELPDSARVQQPYGTVLALSPDLTGYAEKPTRISVGDVVYFTPYAGSEVRVTDPSTGVETIYLILLLDDLIAVKTPTEVVSPTNTFDGAPWPGPARGGNLTPYSDPAHPTTNFPYGTAPVPLNQED